VLQVTQDVKPTTELTFTGNRVDGGTCSVKLAQKGRPSLGPVTVSANRFGRHMSIADCAILRTHATTLISQDNRWAADGTPVAVTTYG
jgi:hypothetical protein